jgi:hypothetical protein
MRYKLRTLFIVLAVLPPILAGGYFYAKWRVSRNEAAGKRLITISIVEKQVFWPQPPKPRPSPCLTWLMGEISYQENRQSEIIVDQD